VVVVVVVVAAVVAAVVAVTAAASVEEVSAAAVSVAFAAALMAGAFAAGLTVVAFAAVGSTIATSTIDSSSLAILGTRSFTIPIHITATIPTAIILMVTDTVAFAVVAFVAVAFVAVGDPYNQPVYQGSGGHTDSLIGRVQLRLARAGYYYGSIDSVSDSGTRAEADP